MSRLQRLEFQGAIHLIRIRGRAGDSIFFDAGVLATRAPASPVEWPVGLRHFARLAWAIFCESGALVHAYALEPDCCQLVLQTLGQPLHAIMRRLCGEYSRYVHRQRGIPAGRRAFAARYESRVVAPNYLPQAIRRVHCSPVRARLVAHHSDYPFSSDGVYAGGPDSFVKVETAYARRLLAQRRFTGAAGYRRFMEVRESARVARLLDHGSPLDSRIAGNRGYVASVGLQARRSRAAPTPEQLTQAVAVMIQRSPEEIRSHRSGALGRALVAWYATRTGAARSLAEVARWFCVTGATLGVAIRNYRGDEKYRPLFDRRGELVRGLPDRHA